MAIKWVIAAVATVVWLYFCRKANKSKHTGEWITLGIHELGKGVVCLWYTFLYAIFWILWLIIF